MPRHKKIGFIISVVGLIIIVIAGYMPVAIGLMLFTLGNDLQDSRGDKCKNSGQNQ